MTLHILGKTYGRPPSSWMSELTELEAFALDTACLRVGLDEEDKAVKRARSRKR